MGSGVCQGKSVEAIQWHSSVREAARLSGAWLRDSATRLKFIWHALCVPSRLVFLSSKRQGPIYGNNVQVLINRCSKFQNLVNFCILLLSSLSSHFLHSKTFFVLFTGNLLGSHKFHLIVFMSLLLFFFSLLKYSLLLPFSSSFLAVIGPRVKHYL